MTHPVPSCPLPPHGNIAVARGRRPTVVTTQESPHETGDSGLSRPLVRILDDDRSVQIALGKLMEANEIEASAFGSVSDFLARDDGSRPGCLLLDVGLPDISGLEFQARLSQLGIHLPVIIITGNANVPMTVQAMKAGAIDFLTKPFRQKDVIQAVLAAVSADRSRRMIDARVGELRQRYDALTDRERQMIHYVMTGLRNKEIAEELSLSVVTVKLYRASMMRKMGTSNVVELVQMMNALDARN